jgi:hypothetical protein
MKNLTRLGCLAAAATAATGLLSAPAGAAPAHPQRHDAEHAVFVQTDETSGNHVAAYRQAPDGTLTLERPATRSAVCRQCGK